MYSIPKRSFPVPVDLESLLAGLQELKKDHDRKTVWDWLYKMSDKCGYGIHTEIIANVSVKDGGPDSEAQAHAAPNADGTVGANPIGDRLILVQMPQHKRKLLNNKQSTAWNAQGKAQCSRFDKKYL